MAVLDSFNSPAENMNLLLGQLIAISIPLVLGCIFRIRFTNTSMSLYNDLVMVGVFRFALPAVNKLDWAFEVWLPWEVTFTSMVARLTLTNLVHP
jgi:hypothetical protein